MTTSAAFLDQTRSILFVHAHPDDESLWSGNLMTEFVDRGADVALVTTNRGELGMVVAPELAHLHGTDELGPAREDELRGALEVLGVTRHAFLGRDFARAKGRAPRDYRDSGMVWVSDGVAGPTPDAAADSRCFTSAPFDEAVADVAAAIASTRPDAIVTYDDHGGYGHPDHIRAHEITAAAAKEAGVPAYAIVLQVSEVLPEGAELWFDLPHQTDRIREALRRYRTQLRITDDGEVEHENGYRHPVPTGVGLSRIA